MLHGKTLKSANNGIEASAGAVRARTCAGKQESGAFVSPRELSDRSHSGLFCKQQPTM
jgi:hypothetical protein